MNYIFISKNDVFYTELMASKLQNRHVFKTSHLVSYYDASKG